MTQPTEQTPTVWLTPAALAHVQQELADSKGPIREEIIARISEARDEGDLKENGGYHAAREEQGKLEGRIRQLEDVLLHATSDPAEDDGLVSVGKVITYKFEGDDDDEAETFLMGARENEDVVEGLAVYSPQAPLGTALLGAGSGSVVEFEGPNGRVNKVQVIKAVPYSA